LSKDSAAELAESDDFPGPMTEIQFWEAKCMNLESVYEQMKATTTQKMASILSLTDRYKSTFAMIIFGLLLIMLKISIKKSVYGCQP